MPASGARVDEARLWGSLEALARIGATPQGGVRRLAFTAEDRAGRAHFIAQCRALDMRVERDAIGNLFALMSSADGDAQRASIMVGSHLDTQAPGGKYDGAYGVMCALEIARTLHAQGRSLRTPFEIVVWANEEGARFAPPMMGSGVFVERFALEDMKAQSDAFGASLGEDLATDTELLALPPRPARDVRAYFEPHIEQGPILEQQGAPIGIVVGAQAVRWLDVQIEGFATHAGPTPMPLRRDALLAAAEVALAAEVIALDNAPHGRATAGQIAVADPARNVAPGAAKLWLDLRHPDEPVLDNMIARLSETAAQIGARRRVEIAIKLIWRMEATRFDPALVNALRSAAQANGAPAIDMISGAGHDALHLALRYPAAMLFTPCEGGISHNEAENMRSDHAALACQILYDAIEPMLTGDASKAAA